ncbi:hypothetical protein N8I77_012359 [Diaporthe amygdali]|uniref:Tyrosinase copper-binding domain-containing protein n=1 Tax=Phomopsis amygdali TaxID=1214568 RepID=A0AAD9S2L9_PHOAM|nr:hypothetical protein N8I77_012359 [Diaporthe amygdali]
MTLLVPFVLAALALWASEVVADEQQSARISVTGPLTGIDRQTGAAPARMNINDMWARGGPSWDLYVLALAELQAVDESDELSYFQIMGIHGLPFRGWSDVGQVAGGSNMAGFCPHSQTLVTHAIQIAQQYASDKAPTYRDAAEKLRVAYWDWAADPSLPEVITLENIGVNGPNGPVTIRNPLHSYYFQNYPFTLQYMNGGPLSKQNHSTRCPTKDLVDDVAKVNAGLASSGFKGQVYNTFTTVTSFQNMETDRYTSASFESPHNNVHNTVGCSNGSMYDLNWSAFDPAFMLHHANVDRLIALWQAIYPNASIFNVVDWAGALYGTPAGYVSADTPLKPFHDDGGGYDGFHTSRSVRDISVLGYTYPELQVQSGSGSGGGNSSNSSQSLSPDELADHVRFMVNALYSNLPPQGNDTAPHLRSLAGRLRGMDRVPTRRPHATRKTWSVAISVDRADVPLPATIGCFLGEGNQVGRMSLLAIPAEGVTHSTIPLDTALGAVGGLDLADAEEVAGYLNQTLRFEVVMGDGTPIDNIESIPSLQFVVQDRDYTPRENDMEFPTYGPASTRKWGRRHGRWAMSD